MNSTFLIYSSSVIIYSLHINVVRSCEPPLLFIASVFVVLEMDLPFKALAALCFPVELRFLNGKSESKLFDFRIGKTHAERLLFRL